MSDAALVKALNRLAAAVERLAAGAGQQPNADEPCVRCNGRGQWAPGVPCHVCGGSGRQ